jgi:hypothetical protein
MMNNTLNKSIFCHYKICSNYIFVYANIFMLIQLHLNLKNQYQIMMMFSMINISMSLIGFDEHLFHNSITTIISMNITLKYNYYQIFYSCIRLFDISSFEYSRLLFSI